MTGVKMSERQLALLFIVILATVFTVLSVLSKGTYGGADDYLHYMIARDAFLHPCLLLDHWGKPVFTLFASLFAQAGYLGVKSFNLLMGLWTGWLLFLLARKFGMRHAALAPVILLFMPIYSALVLSGMTEVIFSFMLVAAAWLFFNNRYILAAIVISFIPMARTESLVLLPIYFTALIWNRKWLAVPFLGTGFLLYGIAGWLFCYNDFFWLITRNPYHPGGIYGTGELLHYVKRLNSITGLVALFYSIPGFVLSLLFLFRKGFWKETQKMNELFFFLFPLVVFFAAHSYVYWKVPGQSIGLIRVMACIVPLWAFYALRGFDWILNLLDGRKVLKVITLLAGTLALVWVPFKIFTIPVPQQPQQVLMDQAAKFILEEKLTGHKIYYFEPYLIFKLGIDAFDGNKAQQYFTYREWPSESLPDSSLLVWDAQFGPNEGTIPLEKLMRDPQMRLLKVFKPVFPFKVFRGYDYEVYIFRKEALPINSDNYSFLEKLLKDTELQGRTEMLYATDFEAGHELMGLLPDSSIYLSGKWSVVTDTTQEYSLTVERTVNSFESTEKTVVRAGIMCYLTQPVIPESLALVGSVEHKGKVYAYYAVSLSEKKPVINQWTRLDLQFELPAVKSRNDLLKIYLWQPSRSRIYLDDYHVELVHPGEE